MLKVLALISQVSIFSMSSMFREGGTMSRVDRSSIILTTLSHLRYYLVSINLNYLYNFGFLLGVSIFIQTVSGLFLTLIYYTNLQLYSNIYIMTYDFYYGYLYRNIHILLATIINILLLIHMFKGLLYTNFSNQIYIHYSGYVLYLLLVVISYLGYILTYGQLSYWGATVIINLLPVSLATLILGSYSISSITINRYLILHMLLTLILYVFIVIHIFYLHQMSSQSPLPVSVLTSPASQLNITFQHFILKDITSLVFLLFIFISVALFILLNLSHSMNLIPVNPLSTPSHIVPEWYFLYLYSILKIVPSKFGGILTVLITILVLLLLTTSNYSYNLYNINNINISTYSNIDTLMTIVLTYIYLAYIGLQLPIAPYLFNLRIFLLYLPVPVILINLLANLPSLPLAKMANLPQFNNIILSIFNYLSSRLQGVSQTISKTIIFLLSSLPSSLRSSVSSLRSSAEGRGSVSSVSSSAEGRDSNISYISLLSTTNHKRIGLYYLLTGSYIAILGIVLSIIMRVELYSPSSTIIHISNVSFYNYSITNHGLLMLLFIVMPILFGAYGNYLLVLSVGLIDIVFPRINNFGWLLLLLAYLMIQFSILTEYLTGTGWTLYPPLSTITSTYIVSTMFLALSLSGVSSLLTSVNYLLLIPYLLHVSASSDLLMVSFLITALMVLYTIPVLAGAFLLATSDILLSTSYFSNYGDPVLYEHLFWFFGHPEVYILIIPSFGLINYQLSQYTSNYIFGSISMILALISILIFGSLVWVHHMFTVNLETDTNLYFSILTLVIAIPTGTKLFNWLFLAYSQPFNVFQTYNLPILLCFIFLMIIIQGGVTGVVLGNNILDLQLHDTYYVVAHFHYILSVGSVLSIFITLVQLSSYISPARLETFLMSCLDVSMLSIIYIMLNTIFGVQYFLGFNTMPRRICNYPDYLAPWNSVSTIGVITLYLTFLLLILT
jgi:cytochrome c oxidase subunit 1